MTGGPVPARPFATVAALAFLAAALFLRPAAAQELQAWIQVEAQPTRAEAEDRARAYTALFPETEGFQLRSGWYAIMLGPYPEDEAARQAQALLVEGLIPADSFLAFERDFGPRYWPPEGETATPEVVLPGVAAPEISAIPDETRSEARDTEALLSQDQREEIQVALQWFGFYDGGIDGAYGPGTRTSMAAWQEAQGIFDTTGVLTSRQRAELLAAYEDETAAFGFAEVTDDEAGITVSLPIGLVEFDRYEPPFVHYRARDASAPAILLISQPGDQAELSGLYDILQTLEAVPMVGQRSRGERSFRITGQSDSRVTTAYAGAEGGLIKGWMLVSTPGNEARDARILQRLEKSFDPSSPRVLDPGMVPMDAGTRAGLLSGLEVRKPRFSRSGFFVDGRGTVLTTSEAVQSCGRITLDRVTEASVALSDPARGIALLTPTAPLSPLEVADLRPAPERVGSSIMASGYSYEDRLPAPVMTFGTLQDLTGLNGEPGLRRLGIDTLPGDAGGPVLDGTGAVIGMLLAPEEGDRQLPPGVQFVLSSAEIAGIVPGISPLQAARTATLAPADLTRVAGGMTVLVSCWD